MRNQTQFITRLRASLENAWRDHSLRDRAATFGGIVLLWAVYVAVVELVAHTADREIGGRSLPGPGDFLLHGFIGDLSTAPPLARWDSIWYYEIAREGYNGAAPESRHTPAFFPLYALAMRVSGELLGGDFFRGGIWVSRLSLLAALCLLACYVRDTEPPCMPTWPALAALLAFPSAFILVSVYSESLFLALVLSAFILARRRRFVLAACFVIGASMTRIQGLSLVPALALMASEDRRTNGEHLLPFLPVAAGIIAYAVMAVYCWRAFGDPFYHLSVKRELWDQGFTAPWTTFDRAIQKASAAAAQPNLAALYTLLQLPCAYLAFLSGAILACQTGRRPWAEIAFVACSLTMSSSSGDLGGMPRFVLVLFPVFTVLGKLRRWSAVWHAYIIFAAMAQACLVIHYVSFRAPPP